MIKIILIFALLQYAANFIFGFKSNVLSCGIFGQATNNPAKLETSSVNLLGIYNIERGKMSCGLTWDGEIQHGLGVDKLYSDFIIDREIKPKKIPVMFGHTRQPSAGAVVTIDNAHPFGFGTSNDEQGYEFIGCHNGTLKNATELAEKYKIETSESIEKNYQNSSYQTQRKKIDSEILLEIIYRTKTFKVLSDYIGTAALVWTWVNEPEKVYLWSGASRYEQGSKTSFESEERPLCVYQKGKNNMFFSSINKSLSSIGADSKVNYQIKPNTVYVVSNGNFKEAVTYNISRDKAGQSEKIEVFSGRQNGYNQAGFNSKHSELWNNYYPQNNNFNENLMHVNANVKNDLNSTYSLINIQEDKPLKAIDKYIGKVYSKSLRYWKSGYVINGIFLYVKSFGFIKIGDNVKDAVSSFALIKGKVFNYNLGIFDSFDMIKNGYVPFSENVIIPQYHYFIDGVLLKTVNDYAQCCLLKNNLKSPQRYIEHSKISFMSKHPVSSMEFDNTVDKKLAILDGENFDGNITELGFEKVYYFKNGQLLKWHIRKDILNETDNSKLIVLNDQKEIKFNPEILKSSIEEIEKIEKEFFVKSLNKFEDEEENESQQDDINEIIMDCFQKHREELTDTMFELSAWGSNPLVVDALLSLNLIDQEFKNFVENSKTKI
jgi:hypothetical protein